MIGDMMWVTVWYGMSACVWARPRRGSSELRVGAYRASGWVAGHHWCLWQYDCLMMWCPTFAAAQWRMCLGSGGWGKRQWQAQGLVFLTDTCMRWGRSAEARCTDHIHMTLAKDLHQMHLYLALLTNHSNAHCIPWTEHCLLPQTP